MPAFDQRGFSRNSGGALDIGAVQMQKPDLGTLTGGTYGGAYQQTITATENGGAGGPYTFAFTGTLPAGLTLDPTTGTLSGNLTAAGVFNFTVTATDSGGYKGSRAYSIDVAAAVLTVTANPETKFYGMQDPVLTYQASGFQFQDTAATVLTGYLTRVAGETVAGGPYAITQGTLAANSNYTIAFTGDYLTITPASLSATNVNFSATAGAPFNGTVATFTTSDTVDKAGAFTVTITWEDGSTSSVVPQGSNGSFTVTGSHTFADPSPSAGYKVSVQISNPNTTPNPATVSDTVTVTSLGQNVVKGLTGTIGFWHNSNGQLLITSFNGGQSSTALSAWLVATFPNLYGAGTGSNNLTGMTNAQVAAYLQTLFSMSGSKAQAQVLAVALNVYATTSSLGGNAGKAYGFTVSAAGLGAYSFNVGTDGAAFGVANNTTLNVYELLQAVNKQAKNGVLYGGDATLQSECADLFTALNNAGDI
jgi:hypothetical protein